MLCIRYPALLTLPDARALYPMDAVRFLIHMPPGRGPRAYGVAGSPVPPDYPRQLVYPFTAR